MWGGGGIKERKHKKTEQSKQKTRKDGGPGVNHGGGWGV